MRLIFQHEFEIYKAFEFVKFMNYLDKESHLEHISEAVHS